MCRTGSADWLVTITIDVIPGRGGSSAKQDVHNLNREFESERGRFFTMQDDLNIIRKFCASG